MSSDVSAIIAFGFLSALLLIWAWRRDFFLFPVKSWEVPLRFYHLIGAFLIYFLITFLLSSIVISLLKKQIQANYLAYSSWFNFGLSFLVFISLAIYMKCLPEPVRKGILCRSTDKPPYWQDIGNALFAWMVSFPLVLFLSQVIELITLKLFHISSLPDQLAVKFLKSTFEHPTYFVLAIFSIVVLAPLIEETLFRGFFQTFIRQHLGSKQAIVITSVCFSLFHYSASQGLGNISIICSLFVLSLFLGFLYEKQGSLLAPMVLHSSFNAISAINLYLFGGFTTGL